MANDSWNSIIASLPYPHILQSAEWGQVKSRFGWQPLPQIWKDERGKTVAAALVLRRSIPIGGFAARLCVLYVPKGPLCEWSDSALRRHILSELAALARQQGAIFVKIDPDVPLGIGFPGQPGSQEDPLGQAVVADLQAGGWRLSDEQVQFRNTVLLDLRRSLDDLLANMKHKTRYNIRLAERKGVTVRVGSVADIPTLFRMYAETSVRDNFVIRETSYYQAVWSTFIQAGLAEPLVAEVEGQPVAGLFVFRFAGKGWYLYGMSSAAHREKMPNHLLQWEAIRHLKTAGCHTYDLWGAPDTFKESDPLWGVYRFKEGLGGQVVRHIGAWDLPLRPFWYQVYTQTLPRLLEGMRRRGNKRTRHVMG